MTLHASSPKLTKRATTRTTPGTLEAHADEASAYFKRVRGRLYKNPAYRHKFVAIRDRKVVDVHADKFVLRDRLQQRFPDRKYFVMPVLQEFPTVDIG